MPAYFSVEFSFEKSQLYPNFVEDIYASFFNNGFNFQSGYWEAEHDSLDKIIAWNQKLLEKEFKLGFRQHVKHDYKQILLNTRMYEHMRLFWMYVGKEIKLSLIIPEYDLITEDSNYKFFEDKILPIIELSKSIWNTGLPQLIQSCLELDTGGISIKQLKEGEIPNINPFCILKSSAVDIIAGSLNGMDSGYIENNGVLVLDRSLI